MRLIRAILLIESLRIGLHIIVGGMVCPIHRIGNDEDRLDARLLIEIPHSSFNGAFIPKPIQSIMYIIDLRAICGIQRGPLDRRFCNAGAAR